MESEFAQESVDAMDGLFDAYVSLLEPMQAHLDKSTPPQDDAKARQRAIRALALDICRALLPAGTVSNLGIFATGQAAEQLVMRLRAHRLPQARPYAELTPQHLRKAPPQSIPPPT